jgi:N-acetylmuramoyl-L-alanine amidase
VLRKHKSITMVSDFIQKNVNILRIILLITFLMYYISFTANANAVNVLLNNLEDPKLEQADVAKPKKKFKIVIDAGHGGHDPGAVGKHSKEKDLTLQMSNKLAAKIEQTYPDVQVLTTRTDDVFIPLFRRIQYANEQHADLFVSIHCNFISSPKTKGTETFVMGLHRADENLAVAKRENASITLEQNYKENYEGYDPNSDEGHIMMSMFQNAYLDKSISFAAEVENQFGTNKDSKSRGVKQAGFAVLRRATMPAVLVEAGFLSNEAEEEYLLSAEGQANIVNSLLKAFDKFYQASQDQTSELSDQKISKEDHTIVSDIPKKVQQKTLPSVKNQGQVWKVQIAATKGEVIDMDSPSIRKVGTLEILNYNDLNKYLVGSFDTREEAISAKEKLISYGYEGAFIVAIK